ncbi:PhzF family phenazine biosynthesis protein [Enterococcus sp. BWR-S5]|uniref:PhzF family phenazine biosynthesis protein n=1 Tax=Enterococcus sp. BWR-S5 TaxID=2787714 RepID=UPI001F3749FF|nr:PhzF family phenazine biosynthesis protein [Enterococcus sp. BWR-S5]MBL1225698.1 PhzF family phenazine biosynthesis protein [Enterococcus sp. BWR-S5]
MKIKSYVLNAFTKDYGGGNPAGVVLDTEQLSENHMQAAAKILGFSETAFLLPSDKADWQIRYFTPVEEVPICGHATVALFSALLQLEEAAIGWYTIETKAGILSIEITENQQIFLQQTSPHYLDILPAEKIAASLNLAIDDLHEELPIQIVSTGLKDILIPVKSLETLSQVTPDFEQITQLSKKHHVTGYHVFSLETSQPQATAQCRNFAPLFDIPEESATGTSNAALACYLAHYLRKEEEMNEEVFIFEQGYSRGAPSEIIAKLSQKKGLIHGIYVGGTASDYLERELEV